MPKHEQYPDPLQPVPPKRTKAEWLASGGQGKEMAFDPVPIFQGLSAQILFVWGEQDSIVPAEESRRAIMAGLADHTNYTIFMVPKAGHALLLLDDTIHCQQTIGDEYQTLVRVPRAYAPGLWDKIINWVKIGVIQSSEYIEGGAQMSEDTGKKFAELIIQKRGQDQL